MLVFPGAFHGGVAALLDGFDLAAERRSRVLHGEVNRDPDVHLTLLSPDGAPIILDRHAELKVDRPIAGSDRFDFVWIPAFRAGGQTELRERLARERAARDWLSHQARQGALVGASGSAIALPLAAGLVRGFAVPIVPALVPTFRAVFPRVRHEAHREIVERNNLLLGRGISCDFELIARAFDRVLSPATGHWLRSVLGGGAETRGDEEQDPLVETARLWLEQRFADPVSIAALAEELHVSHAVLIRRFRKAKGMTPSAYLRTVRLETAQRLLEGSNRSIKSIAAAVGYGDTRNFRQMFKQETGINASDWRASKMIRIV